MKRIALLCALVAVLLVTFSASAPAFTQGCNKGNLAGTNKSDKLVGGGGDNVICGEGGNDEIAGRGGQDKLKGDRGDDTMDGGDGDDIMKGGLGRDVVRGGPGDDVLRGGTHDKTNDGARDIISCGSGTDTVYFTPNVDVVKDDCEILNPPE